MDIDVRQYPHLHAGCKFDSGRDELETGGHDDFYRQRDCPGADVAEFAPRRQVWSSISSVGSRIVWRAGSQLAAVLRALVACGWFGIQTWIGGEAISTLLATLAPGWKNFPYATAVCFFLFWLINLVVILMGIDSIRILQGISAPVLLGVGLLLLAWAYHRAGGFGPMLAAPSRFTNFADFLKFLIPALNGTVGFWATVSLNIPTSRDSREINADRLSGRPYRCRRP